eukprot:GHVP01013682.1.p1 GENE.GHVP01013682.1~~GHVP01013682.1.p1  ORF type:complete len:225 (-),score=41.59 GHVP01013682.1:153-827(-)
MFSTIAFTLLLGMSNALRVDIFGTVEQSDKSSYNIIIGSSVNAAIDSGIITVSNGEDISNCGWNNSYTLEANDKYYCVFIQKPKIVWNKSSFQITHPCKEPSKVIIANVSVQKWITAEPEKSEIEAGDFNMTTFDTELDKGDVFSMILKEGPCEDSPTGDGEFALLTTFEKEKDKKYFLFAKATENPSKLGFPMTSMWNGGSVIENIERLKSIVNQLIAPEKAA